MQGWREGGVGREVVALFADVGVGAGAGSMFSGAVAVRDAGFEHLGSEPLLSFGCDGRLAGGGEGDAASELADCFVVGSAEVGEARVA